MAKNGDVFQVDCILKQRMQKGKREFLVKWKGYHEKFSTWEPKTNILDPRLIENFHRELEEKATSNSSEQDSDFEVDEMQKPQRRGKSLDQNRPSPGTKRVAKKRRSAATRRTSEKYDTDSEDLEPSPSKGPRIPKSKADSQESENEHLQTTSGEAVVTPETISTVAGGAKSETPKSGDATPPQLELAVSPQEAEPPKLQQMVSDSELARIQQERELSEQTPQYSGATGSGRGACVVVTDVSVNNSTVIFKENYTPRGFFSDY